jgi:hypothetical protein
MISPISQMLLATSAAPKPAETKSLSQTTIFVTSGLGGCRK